MNSADPARDEALESWLERTLREDAGAAPLADAGFAARVMAALPPPAAAALPRWRKPVLAVLWTVAAVGLAAAVPELALDLGRAAYRLVAARPVSLLEIGSALLVLGVASWSVAGYAWLRSDAGPAPGALARF